MKRFLQSTLRSQLLTKLETLRNTPEADRFLGDNWPTDQAFNEATLFIDLLPLPDIFTPKIYIAHDGEINFLWKRDDGLHVDLGFYGEETYSYYAVNRDGQEAMDDGAPVSQGLSHKLVEMLAT